MADVIGIGLHVHNFIDYGSTDDDHDAHNPKLVSWTQMCFRKYWRDDYQN